MMKDGEKRRKERNLVFLILLMLFSLIFITLGVSYAFFNYNKVGEVINTIEAGALSFLYDENQAVNNGIILSNASPISDSEGKMQSNHIFEFQINATAEGMPIYYEIYLTKEKSSTFPEKAIKTYLTTIVDGSETEVIDPVNGQAINKYENLGTSKVSNGSDSKTLYQEMISNLNTNYQKTFRLRMWIDEDANEVVDGRWIYSGMTFSVKVNIYASNEVLPEPTKPIYKDSSGANVPELVDGMIPVKYDENKWVKADISSEWYNYINQEWANAVTVTEETRSNYMSAPAGTEISMNDINTMWVWIPRYEYQFTNLGEQYAGGTEEQPGEIKINFVSTNTTNSSGDEYKVHPAFTFGGKELAGIWIGKFEVTGTLPSENYCNDENCDVSTITIKPNELSLRRHQVATFFYAARSMQTNNYETYGFSNDNSYNIHMSKNSEWGAVAYLSQSKYGKYGNSNYEGTNKEIYQNKSSEFITGSSNGTPSTDVINEQVAYDTPDTGYGASTTGTIYGIYDMSGGSYEYVMGNYNNEINGSGFIEMPELKYYDLYTSEDDPTVCNGSICYGHSLSETAEWYSDNANYVVSNYPWMNRGGYYEDGVYAGVFDFASISGKAYTNSSSRFTITP